MAERAFGIGIELLVDNEGGDARCDVREYRRSKPGLGSYTRSEDGGVERGMSMTDGHRESRCHEEPDADSSGMRWYSR